MKTYVRIYGPPVVKATRALEKIAAESPEVLIKGYYDTLTPTPSLPGRLYSRDVGAYLASIPTEIPMERRKKLISKSGHTLGEYDFFFEWARDPTWKEFEELLTKIDEALAPLGCKYTTTTK